MSGSSSAANPPFIPEFLARCGIKPGEWMYDSKLTLRTFMRPHQVLKVRIMACLMLQSFGYETDLAVIMKRIDSKPMSVPLSPQGIGSLIQKVAIAECKASDMQLSAEQEKALKPDRRQLRRALAEMEEEGLLVRVKIRAKLHQLSGLSLDQALEKRFVIPIAELSALENKKLGGGGAGLGVYLRPKPLPANSTAYEPYVGGNVLMHYPHTSPQFPLFSSLSRELEMKLSREQLAQLADDPAIQAAKEVFATAFRTAVEKLQQSAAKPASVSPPVQQSIKIDQPVSGAESKAKEEKRGEVPPQSKPPAPDPNLSPADVSIVLEAMRRYCPADENAGTQLLADCRKSSPHCTAVDVAEAVKLKGPACRGKPSPVGYLMTCVRRLFAGAPLQSENPASNLRKPPAPEVAVCPKCGCSGLIGFKSEEQTLADMAAAVRAGTQFCDCEDGRITRELLTDPRRSVS